MEFSVEVYLQINRIQTAIKRVIKSLMQKHKHLLCMKSVPEGQAVDNIKKKVAIKER